MQQIKKQKKKRNHWNSSTYFGAEQGQRREKRFEYAMRTFIKYKIPFSIKDSTIILINPKGTFDPVHGQWELEDGRHGAGLSKLMGIISND
jgi:hypothetical protein